MDVTISRELVQELLADIEYLEDRIEEEWGSSRPVSKVVKNKGLMRSSYYRLLEAAGISIDERVKFIEDAEKKPGGYPCG